MATERIYFISPHHAHIVDQVLFERYEFIAAIQAIWKQKCSYTLHEGFLFLEQNRTADKKAVVTIQCHSAAFQWYNAIFLRRCMTH